MQLFWEVFFKYQIYSLRLRANQIVGFYIKPTQHIHAYVDDLMREC